MNRIPIGPPPSPNLEAALLLDTPEKAVVAWFNAWKVRNFDAMFTASPRTWKAGRSLAEGRDYLENAFGCKTLISFLPPVREPAPPTNIPGACVADFRIDVQYDMAGVLTIATIRARLISEAAPYRPATGPGSHWGVSPLSALREEKPTNAPVSRTGDIL